MKLKQLWPKYKKFLIPFVIALGITPAVFVKVISDYQQKVKWHEVSNKIYYCYLLYDSAVCVLGT